MSSLPSGASGHDVPSLTPRCPLLGATGRAGEQSDPIEHPSFENRCWSGERPASLLLTDQATLCLCSGFRHCPRFVAARAARRVPESATPPATVPFRTPQKSAVTTTVAEAPEPPETSVDDPLTHALHELEAEIDAADTAQTKSRRRWGWIGAGLIFMSSLVCGGLFAAYVGWQMVRTDVLATEPGSVDTLSAAPAVQPQVYLIVTATSEPAAVGQSTGPSDGSAAQAPLVGPTPIYPAAVTPTPGAIATTTLSGGGVPVARASALEQNSSAPVIQAQPQQQAQPIAPVATATSPVDVQLQIPTRRPTPVLDIPTSTPSALDAPAAPVAQPTLAPLGTPFVLFSARDTALESGECTLVTWHVENVRAVFYENLGVDGQGEHEECVRGDPGDYNLTVVLGDGSTRTYTATVDLIIPTDTPRPTPTFTIPPEPTATWTPNVPTNTPLPTMAWGVRLEANGGTDVTCSRGTTCQVDLYVSNTASAVDSINLAFTEAGAWPYSLCRLDGVCSNGSMTLVNVSPSNTGVIQLKIDVPSDPAFNEMTYRLRATSENSGGSATSDQLTIRVTAE